MAPRAATSGIARRRAAARDDRTPGYTERRREIIQAAARVFKAKGLGGATLGDIAAESGTDRASLYYYVGSKQELFHEVVREAVEANLATAKAIRDGKGSAPDKLRSLVESLMLSYAAHFPVLYVFIQENLSHVPDQHVSWATDMRSANFRYERILADIVQQGLDEGTIRPLAPAWVITHGVIGMLGWTNRWFNPATSEMTAEELGRAFADMLLGGLLAPSRPT